MGDRPRGGLCLYVYGGAAPNRSDRALEAQLDMLGFEVRMVLSSRLPSEADVLRSSLVVISSTSNAAERRGKFRDLPVPLVTWESVIYDDLGFVESCSLGDCGRAERPPEIQIKDTNHPLARGLVGVVRISPSRSFWVGWATRNIRAAWVATAPGSPTQAILFAYEKGASMAGLTAPARRVALPLSEVLGEDLNEAGWLMFDDAITWATERN